MSDKKILFKSTEKKSDSKIFETDKLPWYVAIVDDDEQVHQITTMVLQSFQFDGRPLSFLYAYSEAEAYPDETLTRKNNFGSLSQF